ncbi:MAG: M48 family metallopeptidase [Saprospirales bacterium]|jgi:predicted Zn-dependent protease|nr:M48 family metallopeptidase [Saprospirales bacterium]MBK8921325.1 M48 family metallopeptidase [Saprospirales bacterium]
MFGQNQRGSGISPKLLIAIVLAGFALSRYYCNSAFNDITGESQHISISPEQEVAMGLQSAPQMISEMGGEVTGTPYDALVRRTGQRLVDQSDAAKTIYRGQFNFHLLADQQTINAFALPGGQIFITAALLGRLTTNGQSIDEDMLAGVLGHEIGHVVARHSAEKLAQMELAQGLTGAVTMATYDPNSPNSGYIAQMVSNMLQMKYGREQELQSDDLGVRFLLQAGYNPEQLINVMEVLKQAAGPNRTPEFQSTHPDPENRKEHIRAAIEKYRGQ